jgi:hypothetical protein
MNRRKPGGDLRVVCGQLTDNGRSWIVGLTFRDRAAYTLFFETPDQVRHDMSLGYPYHLAAPAGHLDVQPAIPEYGGTFPAFLLSRSSLDVWVGEPITGLRPLGRDYSTYLSLEEFWRAELLRGLTDPLTRREQRMAAWFPIR